MSIASAFEVRPLPFHFEDRVLALYQIGEGEAFSLDSPRYRAEAHRLASLMVGYDDVHAKLRAVARAMDAIKDDDHALAIHAACVGLDKSLKSVHVQGDPANEVVESGLFDPVLVEALSMVSDLTIAWFVLAIHACLAMEFQQWEARRVKVSLAENQEELARFVVDAVLAAPKVHALQIRSAVSIDGTVSCRLLYLPEGE